MKPALSQAANQPKETAQPKKQVLIVDNKNDPDAFPKQKQASPNKDLAKPVGKNLANRVFKRAAVEQALAVNRKMGLYVHD